MRLTTLSAVTNRPSLAAEQAPRQPTARAGQYSVILADQRHVLARGEKPGPRGGVAEITGEGAGFDRGLAPETVPQMAAIEEQGRPGVVPIQRRDALKSDARRLRPGGETGQARFVDAPVDDINRFGHRSAFVTRGFLFKTRHALAPVELAKNVLDGQIM